MQEIREEVGQDEHSPEKEPGAEEDPEKVEDKDLEEDELGKHDSAEAPSLGDQCKED